MKSLSSDAPTVVWVELRPAQLVLRALLDTGAIDQATWRTVAAPVRFHDGLRADQRHAQYFKEQVRRELTALCLAASRSGFRVFSTADMRCRPPPNRFLLIH